MEIQGSSTNLNYDKLNKYFSGKLESLIGRIKDIKSLIYFSKESNFIQHIFTKIYSLFKDSSIYNIKYNDEFFFKYKEYIYEFLSYIHYGNNTYTQINYGNDKTLFYVETKLIYNFLFHMLKKMSLFTDIYFIPLFHENNTLLSSKLCLLFKLNHINNLDFDVNKVGEYYDELKKGISTFESRFINKEKVNSQLNMKDLLDLNFTLFYDVNNFIYQGLMNLMNATDEKDKIPYYFMKYSFPNYNILKEFKTEYLLLDQTNFYLYTSFKIPLKYSNYALEIMENCFYCIIIIILYIWILCLFINLLIFFTVINDWTGPIEKL